MDHEEMLQMKFEQSINLLIMYKQDNPNKDIYISEKDLKKAMNWYKNKILKNIKQ
tara:strand:- start:536 stop:700 length:165 start_codon:yes stop_codon:yes gene_type:complete